MGVVEVRPVRQVVSEVEVGKHVAGWAIDEDFRDHFLDHVMGGISDITRRILLLPLGTIVGIWAFTPELFQALYAASG